MSVESEIFEVFKQDNRQLSYNNAYDFRFERQMNVDQEGCTRPDYKNDFSSKEDSVKRLIR